MKIFIEHRGSSRHPWLCVLAQSTDEKRELEGLYHQAQKEPSDGGYCSDNNIEWQQNGFKLMFILQVDQEEVMPMG